MNKIVSKILQVVQTIFHIFKIIYSKKLNNLSIMPNIILKDLKL